MSYYPEKYLTADILKQVLDKYPWPAPYDLTDGVAGNILVHFPACTLVFMEGFESSMNAYFLNSQSGRTDSQASLSVFEAAGKVRLLRQQIPGFNEPDEFNELGPDASREKVMLGIDNICMLLQNYLLPYIAGDMPVRF
ncbi:hypothetical protein SAMN05421788_110120 [Filimonas lacunae]|uniref:Uncharacterized protein n=1 Tax=Filimonas lacunae TaxID=477680 RepID=A0A173MA21_9BACT|nr:hypothetical protein [Filimonas lacunae]BAV04393.1 hypothetical protein FLA_0381 [Filimonas lacunae]SIT31266.1 hypothetical protein SAMN05421788_110120 [Filimonas lacunae]